MAAELVEFACPVCGPVLETFASAEVVCRCGRRCRLPEWVKARAKRRAEADRRRVSGSDGGADSRHEHAGEGVAVSRKRGFSASRRVVASPETCDSGAEVVCAGQSVMGARV